MLEQMGAQIGGVGTSTLEVEGVDRLRADEPRRVPDRIVAGTWAFAAAMTQGDVTVRGGAPRAPRDRAGQARRSAGADVDWRRRRLPGRDGPPAAGRRRGHAALPGASRPTCSRWSWRSTPSPTGAAMITENVFECRFMFVDELARLGADVRTDGHHAVVRGRERLSGAPVRGHDIRAGAGLVARRARRRRRHRP